MLSVQFKLPVVGSAVRYVNFSNKEEAIKFWDDMKAAGWEMITDRPRELPRRMIYCD